MNRIDDLRVAEAALVNADAELAGRLAAGGVSLSERNRMNRARSNIQRKLTTVRGELIALMAPPLQGPPATAIAELSAAASQLEAQTAANLTTSAVITAATRVINAV